MDSELNRMEQFHEFDPRCNWILRSGDMLLTDEERPIYQNFRLGNDLNPEDLPVIRRIFEREARRILGDTRFDVAIEFGGYAPTGPA